MNGHRHADSAIDAFLADGIDALPDRTFDAVRSDIHRTRQRVVIGPWREPDMRTPIRIAVVAAILVVAVGIAWSQLTPWQLGVGGQGTPTPTVGTVASPAATPATTPTLITGENHALAPGRYWIDYARVPGSSDGPAISFDIAVPGWTNFANFAVDRNYAEAISPGASLVFWRITNVSVDPCTDHQPRAQAPGPGIDELLLALGDQEGIRAGALTDVTVDGYRGKYVDLTITANIVECEGGFFTWGDETAGRYAQGTGEVDRVYALDVDGQRITFFTRKLTDTAATHVRQLQQIVDSIEITP